MDSRLRQFLGEGERAALRYALETPRHAPVGLSGGTLSQQAGSSLEFRDHRDYQPGDDLRHVDWNVYARSDQLTVKLYREEVTPHLDLLLDVSRSMALGGDGEGVGHAGTLGLLRHGGAQRRLLPPGLADGR